VRTVVVDHGHDIRAGMNAGWQCIDVHGRIYGARTYVRVRCSRPGRVAGRLIKRRLARWAGMASPWQRRSDSTTCRCIPCRARCRAGGYGSGTRGSRRVGTSRAGVAPSVDSLRCRVRTSPPRVFLALRDRSHIHYPVSLIILSEGICQKLRVGEVVVVSLTSNCSIFTCLFSSPDSFFYIKRIY
jgi:hypothetical protein